MTLQFEKPVPPEDQTYNFGLYGPTDSGKTTGALKAPAPVVLLKAEGDSAVEFPLSQVPDADIRSTTVTGEQVLEDALLYCGDPKNKVKTLVLDSFSETYSILLREHSANPLSPTLPEYGYVSAFMERWLVNAAKLPVNVVVICHELAIETPGGGLDFKPHVGTNKESALTRKLMYVFADVLGYCARVPGDNGADDKFMAQLVNANNRHGKNRGGHLGKFAELDLGAWVRTMHAAQAKAGKATNPKEKSE